MILNINSLIQIEILPGIESLDDFSLAESFISYFTTEMSPMYASVLDVRRLVGAFVSEIPDDVINQLILEWSIIAEDFSKCTIDDKWKRYANKWVAYKASLVILYNTEEFRGASSDKEFKQLGDFSVSKGGGSNSSNGANRMIDWLECEAFKYEFSIRECTDPAINCLGLEDNDALPFKPSVAQLVEKGYYEPNKLVAGRRWLADVNGEPRGNSNIILNKRSYKTNLGSLNLYGNRSI